METITTNETSVTDTVMSLTELRDHADTIVQETPPTPEAGIMTPSARGLVNAVRATRVTLGYARTITVPTRTVSRR